MNIKKTIVCFLILFLSISVYPKNIFREIGRLFQGTRRSIELVLGTVTSASLELSTPVVNDKEMNDRLQNIAQALVPYTKRNLRYRFKILDLPYPNAFAVPGGWVYVTRKLMEMTDDDELACVVGHEIGHIESRHSIQAFERSLIAQSILNYYSKKSKTVDKNAELIAIANMIFNDLRFSRENEREADRYAVDFAVKAGYNPYGMVRFFQKLQEMDKQGESDAFKMLRTHPLTSERINYTSDYIKKRLQ